MTRDVLITINGRQMAGGDSGETELITAGDYFLKNGSHYIVYDEVDGDMDGVIKNTVRVRPGMLDIIKRGNIHTRMTFEKDKKSVSGYMTPFGEMMIGISTKDVKVSETEDDLKILVDYSLDINYQHVSECSLVMDVQSKSTADIHLQS